MRLLRHCSVMAMSLLMVCGCVATDGASETPYSKAAVSLSCPSDQVTVSSLGDNRYGARGCGRYVAYEFYGTRTLSSLRSRR